MTIDSKSTHTFAMSGVICGTAAALLRTVVYMLCGLY